MQDDKLLYVVEKKVLPDVIIKVMQAKELLESGRADTVQEAVAKVGISRSAFYKYRYSVFPFYENIKGKTVTFAVNLENRSGLLSNLLNVISLSGANILTINQTIPLNNIANVILTIETTGMDGDLGEIFSKITGINGVMSLKLIAKE